MSILRHICPLTCV